MIISLVFFYKKSTWFEFYADSMVFHDVVTTNLAFQLLSSKQGIWSCHKYTPIFLCSYIDSAWFLTKLVCFPTDSVLTNHNIFIISGSLWYYVSLFGLDFFVVAIEVMQFSLFYCRSAVSLFHQITTASKHFRDMSLNIHRIRNVSRKRFGNRFFFSIPLKFSLILFWMLGLWV